MADSPAQIEQIQAPTVAPAMEAPAQASLRPNIAGKIAITRYERGMPVFLWKSENQRPQSFGDKYIGEDTFVGMAVGSAILMGLKLTGLVVAGTTGVAALPFTGTLLATVFGGAVIGGLFNGHRKQKQAEQGIECSPPSTPNLGTFHGLMQGTVMGAGMTMLAGMLLHSAVGAAGLASTGFLAQASAVMAPSALVGGTTLLTGAAALSMFTLPLIIAAGAGLYMAHKRGKEHAQLNQTEYQHAVQIFRVQEGHVQGRAPVEELETHLANTRNRNYTPEAATVAGIAVGAAALSAIGANVPHAATHTVSHLAEESLAHKIGHTIHPHQNLASAAPLSDGGSTASSFASRFASNASTAGKTFAERLGTTAAEQDVNFAERLAAARQATTVTPHAATVG